MRQPISRNTARRPSFPATRSPTLLGDSVIDVVENTPINAIVPLKSQSNMINRDDDFDPLLDASDPNIFELTRTEDTIANGGDPTVETLQVAAQPLQNIGAGAGSVSPGLNIAKAILAILPAGSRVTLVPCAKGATGFNNGFWAQGGEGRVDAIARANHAMTLDNGGLPNVFYGIFWHGGESDGGTSQAVQADRIDDIVVDFRANITGASDTTPFVTAGLVNVNNDPKTGVELALEDTPNRLPYSAYYETAGLATFDGGTHFTAAASRTLGTGMGNALNSLSGDLGIVRPSAITDLSVTAGDSEVTLTFTAPSSTSDPIIDYKVFYAVAGSGVYVEFLDGINASNTITVTGLTNDTAYDFDVRAENSAGIAVSSNVVSATPASSSVGVGNGRAAADSVVSGAIVDLSARNDASYDGSSQTWVNLGSGDDFWLGTDGTVESNIDPVFVGTAGDLQANMRFGSPNNRRVTAKSVMPVLNNFHRSDAPTPFTFIFKVRPQSSYRVLIANTTHSGGNGALIWTTGNAIRYRNRLAGSDAENTTFTTTFDITQESLIALTFDPSNGSYQFKVNSSAIETGTMAFSNTVVNTTPATLMSDTGGTFGFDQTTTTLKDFIAYDKVLTPTELTAIFNILYI